ncbi:MAG TPA: glycosyltransferase [Erysipelotrichaceae bacterium]|nr:glycosyltransferase [Erysipelotrichaceae bacterium]
MKTTVKKILLFPLNLIYSVSPKLALKILFRIKNGYKLNFSNPKTYNEKLQWIKINYKNRILPKLVDKFAVRKYISEKCPELLNDLLWEGFDAKKIPWEELPNKFVIKVTHGSGFNIICTDKTKLVFKKCEKKLNRWLKEKFLKCYGEWFYGVEKPRIIIEKFLDDGSGKAPVDYKVLCFSGKPYYIIVDTNRFENHKRNVYDLDWNLLDNVTMDFPNDKKIEKPKELSRMLYYSELLSQGFPHVRVDLYIVKQKIYFGELTFTNGAGFDRILPRQFDLELGSLLQLPEDK